MISFEIARNIYVYINCKPVAAQLQITKGKGKPMLTSGLLLANASDTEQRWLNLVR